MPITQDRLIRLIDITTRSLDWSNTIKTQTNRHIVDLYSLTNSLHNETDLTRLNQGLGIMKDKLRAIESVMQDYPLTPSDSIELGKEQGHFNATSKLNIKARNHMRFQRSRRAEEAVANTYLLRTDFDKSNLDMELEEDLRRQWEGQPAKNNEVIEQKTIEPLPAEVNETLRNAVVPLDAEPAPGDNLDINFPAFMAKKPTVQ